LRGNQPDADVACIVNVDEVNPGATPEQRNFSIAKYRGSGVSGSMQSLKFA